MAEMGDDDGIDDAMMTILMKKI